MTNQSLGQLGENQAVLVLKQQGYRILEQNYRSGRWGEVDIIATHQGSLVFIEVKTRSSAKYGTPLDAISFHKKQKLRRAFEYYKLTHPQTPDSLRFDVVSVQVNPTTKKLDTEVYPNVDLS